MNYLQTYLDKYANKYTASFELEKYHNELKVADVILNHKDIATIFIMKKHHKSELIHLVEKKKLMAIPISEQRWLQKFVKK